MLSWIAYFTRHIALTDQFLSCRIRNQFIFLTHLIDTGTTRIMEFSGIGITYICYLTCAINRIINNMCFFC